MNAGTYFISIGLGRITFDGASYFVISRESPIGQVMDSKKVGDSFEFNGNAFEIKNIS
jgi:transcription elongation GreA/GreB family factor